MAHPISWSGAETETDVFKMAVNFRDKRTSITTMRVKNCENSNYQDLFYVFKDLQHIANKNFAFRLHFGKKCGKNTGQYPSQKAKLQRFFLINRLKIVNGNCCPPGDLLLNGLRVGLAKQVEQQAGEVVGVRVGIPQLQGVPTRLF
jgi:hypothetical protein